MLKNRVAQRGGTLQVQVRQLDSAVSLAESPDRLHPDTDRLASGVRVVVGPETRSLLRQLLESRDLRVQQQLVREIRHQILRKVLAAMKRIKAIERTMAASAATARAARRRGSWLLNWFRSAGSRARAQFAGRLHRPAAARKRLVARSRPTLMLEDRADRTTRTRGRGFGTLPERPARVRKRPAARTRS
jgi:hypothetical protein